MTENYGCETDGRAGWHLGAARAMGAVLVDQRQVREDGGGMGGAAVRSPAGRCTDVGRGEGWMTVGSRSEEVRRMDWDDGWAREQEGVRDWRRKGGELGEGGRRMDRRRGTG